MGHERSGRDKKAIGNTRDTKQNERLSGGEEKDQQLERWVREQKVKWSVCVRPKPAV